MKNKFTLLGSGSSLGSPWIDGYWGSCNKYEKKNYRTRCAAHIRYKNLSILIDTSPDIRNQFQKNKLTNVDAVIYTHEHSDQSAGIFELRPFFWKNKSKIPVYGSSRTINELKKSYTFCFSPLFGYKPIMKSIIVKNIFKIYKKKNSLSFRAISVKHGMINANGYIFNKIAYISDCSKIPNKYFKYLNHLNYLVIDCLRIKSHPSHFNLEDALNIIKKLKPKKAILTNLHVDLDYSKLKKKLPSNVMPAYDGLSFTF
tara:strand:- start:328 stop:1098 length:771 start_codon:yes stop_codon:yes gene_type:complete